MPTKEFWTAELKLSRVSEERKEECGSKSSVIALMKDSCTSGASRARVWFKLRS